MRFHKPRSIKKKTVHAIHDSEAKGRIYAGDKREEAVNQITETLQGKIDVSKKIEQFQKTNPEVQLGKPLTTEALETRLKKLNKNLRIIRYPLMPNKAGVFLSVPTGLEFLMPCEYGIMPEHSIMTEKHEDILDPANARSGGTLSHIERKDLPKHYETPDGLVFEPGLRPGMKRIYEAGSEKVRGWRTVVIRLVKEGIISGPLTEREFGGDDTMPEWAALMGRREQVTPW